MTRYLYGGGGDGDIIQPSGQPYTNAPATVWTARTGGSQVTDLQDLSAVAIGTLRSDSYGQIVFYGPDGYLNVLWVDFGSGVRWALAPKDINASALASVANQRAGDLSGATTTTKAALHTNTADPLLNKLATDLDPLVEPRFASQTLRDAAFPSPADGDRCYRTDLHCAQRYHGGLGRWTAQNDVLIAETVLTAATTTVTFSSIPQAWRNLRLSYAGPPCVGSASGFTIFQLLRLQFNGDTGNDYESMTQVLREKVVSGTTTMHVDGDAAGGNTPTTAATYNETLTQRSTQQPGAYCGILPGSSAPSGARGGGEIIVHNYASASGVTEGYFTGSMGVANVGSVNGYHGHAAGTFAWGSGATPAPAAITSVTLYVTGGGSFASGSWFTLYGIA